MDDFRRRPINRVGSAQPVQSAQPGQPPRPDVSLPSPQPTQAQQPQAPEATQPGVSVAPVAVEHQAIEGHGGAQARKTRRPRKKLAIWSVGVFLLSILLTIGGAFWWYKSQLTPVDVSNTAKQAISVVQGSTPSQIATMLQEEGLIRSASAFLWYARFERVQNSLQAGTYRLSPSESTPEIIKHLSSGKVDTFNITFLPGETLKEHKTVFLKAGYSEAEVTAAFAKRYSSPLFKDMPETADLEGYIYGETYTFSTDATVESILEHTFKQFYSVVEKNGLIAKFAAQNLTLHQGIILASIVQREAGSTPNDMAQISQVFHKRLSIDMELGSDPTYQYIADKLGVPRDININSPYNTRRFAGLPPGPIASPGEKALIATASPAKGDYLFFLSGDDDVTYFSRSLQEHEANIQKHCQEKCQII